MPPWAIIRICNVGVYQPDIVGCMGNRHCEHATARDCGVLTLEPGLRKCINARHTYRC